MDTRTRAAWRCPPGPWRPRWWSWTAPASPRLTLGAIIPELHAKAPKGAIAYLKKFYYDVALSASPYPLASLRELVDPSHILFGSDYPFLPEPMVYKSVEALEAYKGFDVATRISIERDSALALFPRLNHPA